MIGAAAEEAAAIEIHAMPNEAVIRWGQAIGAHGADIISYNLETHVVTLWDVKFRTEPRRVNPSPTFRRNSRSLDSALAQADRAIRMSLLSPADKKLAIESIMQKTFQTRTLGAGNSRNSTFGDHR